MKRFIALVICMHTYCLSSLFAQSGSDIQISFLPVYGASNIELKEAPFKIGDNLEIETLKFYISDIQFLHNGKTIFKESNSYHLIDAGDRSSLRFNILKDSDLSFDQIRFNLGIDSTTNVSGVLGGDLDPTKGMYWAWHSGYINFKLEGKSKLSTDHNNEFQFHLGGYQYPNNAIQNITLNVPRSNDLVIKFDLNDFVDALDLSKQDHIMSPSTEAVELSKLAAKAFKLMGE